MNKQQIRKYIFDLRRTLDKSYFEEANNILINKILTSEDYIYSQTIFTFISVPFEFDTHPLINQALQDGKQIVVPKIEHRKMNLYYFSDWNALERRSYGILEPNSKALSAQRNDIDLVILPCVTCNGDGARLGYGRGYYDNFLKDYHGKEILPYFDQLMYDDIPMSPVDCYVKRIITETQEFINIHQR